MMDRNWWSACGGVVNGSNSGWQRYHICRPWSWWRWKNQLWGLQVRSETIIIAFSQFTIRHNSVLCSCWLRWNLKYSVLAFGISSRRGRGAAASRCNCHKKDDDSLSLDVEDIGLSHQLGLLPIHPGPGGERGGLQEQELQPRQRDMEVKPKYNQEIEIYISDFRQTWMMAFFFILPFILGRSSISEPRQPGGLLLTTWAKIISGQLHLILIIL